jgi:hypothetical protein
LGVIKDGDLWFQDVKLVLHDHQQFADLAIRALVQVFVQ